MQKELTINLSNETYQGLMNLVGEKKASQFIEAVLRPYIIIATKNQGFKIHSPRLVDRMLADNFKLEMIEETENGKI